MLQAASIRSERKSALHFFVIFGGLLFWVTIFADYLYLGGCNEFYQLAAALTVSAVICLVPYYRLEEAQIHQLVAVIMVVIFYSFFPLRLSYQLAFGLFLTIFLLLVMVFAIEARPFDVAGVAIFISLVDEVGYFFTRKAQRLSRLNFWKVILLNRQMAQNRKISGQLRAVHRQVEFSSQQLRDAVDNISEGFVLFDTDQRLLLCNENYRKFYRLTSEETSRGTPPFGAGADRRRQAGDRPGDAGEGRGTVFCQIRFPIPARYRCLDQTL